jgi:integrase
MLDKYKSGFTVEGNYNWLLISIWFGLRPTEIDSLRKIASWRIEKDKDLGIDVLWIYQSKLTSIEREKRWKPLPIIFPEQKLAVEIIKSGSFKRPLAKTLKKIFLNKRITCYAGRKGFIDLMLARNQRLEDISSWLGHQDIAITWRKYRNKKRVAFTQVKIA